MKKINLLCVSMFMFLMFSFTSFAATSGGFVYTSPVDKSLVYPSMENLHIDEKRGAVIANKNNITGELENINILTDKVNVPVSTWEQEHGFWKLRFADGTYPCGNIYFEEDGTMKEYFAWEKVNGKWYAFELNGYMMTGFVYDSNYDNIYYLDDSGAMVTGVQEIDGVIYKFDSVSGHLLK